MDYFCDVFDYKDQHYEIEFSKQITQLSKLLTNLGIDDEPYKNQSIDIDREFDVDYYLFVIGKIFDSIESDQNFSDELLKLIPHGTDINKLYERERNLLNKLKPTGLSSEQFVNTHVMLFKFFDYYDFSNNEIITGKYKNYTIAILAKLFYMYYKGDNEKLAKESIKYLYYNFMALEFERSYTILINDDEYLNYFKKYFIADGEYCSGLKKKEYKRIISFGNNTFFTQK